MRLSEADLQKFLGILERIDRGLAMPSFPDRIGQFLRQYKDGRARFDGLFDGQSKLMRLDGAVSGLRLGVAEIHPLFEPRVGVLGFPLREVADTLAMSEELGGLVNVVMWLKSPMANAAYECMKTRQSVVLDGDYRWSPMAKLAIGAAQVVPTVPLMWRDARCIKAVADDVNRPPHALEYVLDYRMGQPGIKFLRSVCVVRSQASLSVVPAFADPVPLDVSGSWPGELRAIKDGKAAALLIYREPWDISWVVVNAVPIEPQDAFAHVVAWADFQRELRGERVDGETVASIRGTWVAAGIDTNGYAAPNIEHRLLPTAREAVRQLRRI